MNFSLIVAPSLISLIIGKKGVTIRRLREESGQAPLLFSPTCGDPNIHRLDLRRKTLSRDHFLMQ